MIRQIERQIARLRFGPWARLRANRFHSCNLSYSGGGEDMIIRQLFDGKRIGTYVDVGAFHPVFLSNTNYFSSIGWHGMNIDARPAAIELFNLLRPRDINLCAAVSDSDDESVTLHEFETAAISTISASVASDYSRRHGHALKRTTAVRAWTLNTILNRHWRGGDIDLLTLDAEGMDERILRAFDVNRFGPKVICFELNGVPAAALLNAPIVQHLQTMNYELRGFSLPSVIMSRP